MEELVKVKTEEEEDAIIATTSITPDTATSKAITVADPSHPNNLYERTPSPSNASQLDNAVQERSSPFTADSSTGESHAVTFRRRGRLPKLLARRPPPPHVSAAPTPPNSEPDTTSPASFILSTPNISLPPPESDTSERAQFLRHLYSFMESRGQPIVKIPFLGYQELDLYRLYKAVIARGGMDEVTRKQEWKVVYQELDIPTMSTSASYNTRTNYKKYLYLYELEHFDGSDRNRPLGMAAKFSVGDYVRIVSSNYEGKIFYGKISKYRYRNKQNMYYIHYNGWSTAHDEWMPESVLSPLLQEEQGNPELLANPTPTRSSKSNRIIGEAPSQELLEDEKRREKQTLITEPSSSEEALLLAHKTINAPVHSSHANLLSILSQTIHGTPRQRKKRGIDATTVQMSIPLKAADNELEYIEREPFMDFRPLKNVKTLDSFNIHTYDLTAPLAFKSALLQAIDLRVPDIEDILERTSQQEKRSAGGAKASPMVPTSTADTDAAKDILNKLNNSMAAMVRELKQVRKDYRQRKVLLDLYYGPSTGESDNTN